MECLYYCQRSNLAGRSEGIEGGWGELECALCLIMPRECGESVFHVDVLRDGTSKCLERPCTKLMSNLSGHAIPHVGSKGLASDWPVYVLLNLIPRPSELSSSNADFQKVGASQTESDRLTSS